MCFKLPWCVPCSRLGEHLQTQGWRWRLELPDALGQEALGRFLGFFFFFNVLCQSLLYSKVTQLYTDMHFIFAVDYF